MATFYSSQLTSLDSNPVDLPDVSEIAGKIKYQRGTYTLVGTEVANDLIEVARVPRAARIVPFGKIFWEDLGTDVDIEVGTSGDPDALLALTDAGVADGSADLDAAAGRALGVLATDTTIYVKILNGGASFALTAGQDIDCWVAYIYD